MVHELKELSAAVRHTERGVGPCKRIHVGWGLLRLQSNQLLSWMARYSGLLPAAESIVLLPDDVAAPSSQPFRVLVLRGLDRVWGVFVGSDWWSIERGDREAAFVRALLLSSLVRAGKLVTGADGEPVLVEDGQEYADVELERRVQARLDAILQRGAYPSR